MKFICFGYMDETQWDEMAEAEQTTLMKECFYLRRLGRVDTLEGPPKHPQLRRCIGTDGDGWPN